jgi:hypothetical protein
MCGIFRSPKDARLLASMGCSLVDFTIDGADAEAIACVLPSLPHLRRLEVARVKPDSGEFFQVPLPRIPFFENLGEFYYTLDDKHPGNAFQWIPRNPRFSKLMLMAPRPSDHAGVVTEWISLSRKTLELLTIGGTGDYRGGVCLGILILRLMS